MKRRLLGIDAVRAMMAALLLMAGPVLAESPNLEPPKEAAMTRIHVIVGDKTLTATLDDTAAGRAFAALLPLDLTLTDYNGTEKVADLSRKLDTTGAPASYAPKAGDIWAPLLIHRGFRWRQNRRGQGAPRRQWPGHWQAA